MISIGSNFAGLSQITDTLCLPVPVIRKVLIAAEQKKVADSMNIVLQTRIASLNIAIDLLQHKDAATVNGYDKQLQGLKDEIAEYKLQKKEYERLLKWERFRRRFWTGVGVAVVGIMGYLYITK